MKAEKESGKRRIGLFVLRYLLLISLSTVIATALFSISRAGNYFYTINLAGGLAGAYSLVTGFVFRFAWIYLMIFLLGGGVVYLVFYLAAIPVVSRLLRVSRLGEKSGTPWFGLLCGFLAACMLLLLTGMVSALLAAGGHPARLAGGEGLAAGRVLVFLVFALLPSLLAGLFLVRIPPPEWRKFPSGALVVAGMICLGGLPWFLTLLLGKINGLM